MAGLMIVVDIIIVVGGIVSGGWAWGLVLGSVGAVAIVDWLRLRAGSEEARSIADRMIIATSALLLAAAMPAIKALGL